MLVLDQKGVAPFVIVLIIAVTIFTGYGVYRSSNQFNIRDDKTSEKIGGRLQNKEPKTEAVILANSGKLAKKAVELKTDEAASDSAEFSITPPAGWEKLPQAGQILVEFLSPAKDLIEEGELFIDIQPNITVFVAKGDFADLEEAYSANDDKRNEVLTRRQGNTVNGQEVVITESMKDAANLLRDTLQTQIQQEISKSGAKLSREQLNKVNKDMEKVLQQAKVKMVSYSFYKDGYYINVTGKSWEKFWDKRGPQLKKSMDTFKFE